MEIPAFHFARLPPELVDVIHTYLPGHIFFSYALTLRRGALPQKS